ncbi:GDSL-type esterase/lipase family protein [Nonomuraea sp. NPDC046802]|uniref:GDSL-type esterase/lipase family protein n=1 Tax=Nonomuraea sp. NPDC046802 TaxID=3154919 RepID=UPI0033C01A4B
MTAQGRTVTTWSAAAERLGGGGLRGLTVRNVVRTSVGGTDLRIRLTNAFGRGPVTFGHVYVGVPDAGAFLEPGSNRMVTFGGSPRVRLALGATALSDPLPGPVGPRRRLAISLYLDGECDVITGRNRATAPAWPSEPPSITAPACPSGPPLTTAPIYPPEPPSAPTSPPAPPSATTYAPDRPSARSPDPPSTISHPPEPPSAPAYRSLPGDHAADESAGAFVEEVAVWHWLDAVTVTVSGRVSSVAVLGDSITTGVGSETGHGWPDILADQTRLAVANEGVSGGRVLVAGTGRSAEERLTAEVLTKPGIDTVILLAGVNDLGAGAPADALVAAYRRIVERAHAAGVSVIGCTLPPFGGAEYHTPDGERAREAVNTFVRDGGAFDGMADFDAALRDPAAPVRLLPAYDCGDHLHPSAAGHWAMAAAVGPRLLSGQRAGDSNAGFR